MLKGYTSSETLVLMGFDVSSGVNVNPVKAITSVMIGVMYAMKQYGK